MIQIYNPEYYYKTQEYYATEVLLKDYYSWFNFTNEFYEGYHKWLMDEYRCYIKGSCLLNFENEEDYTWFLLRWS